MSSAARLPPLRCAALAVTNGQVLLPASAVAEVVRLVALHPVASASPARAGRFVWRGQPVEVIDVGALLGGPPLAPAPLDAHLVLVELEAEAPFALLVSRVLAVGDEATPHASAAIDWPGADPALWEGVAQLGAHTFPLLKPRALARWLREGTG